MRSAVLPVCVAVGCTSSGSLQLDLTLPTVDDLRPTGMTSISVVASSPDIGSISNTSILTGQSFSAGDLPVGNGIQIDVLFHDVSNRLVGVGEAPNLVDIKGDQTTTLTIPVRRPFVYVGSGTKLYSFDPTLDPRDAKFQGALAGLSSPQLAVSVGGDRLVVASTNQLQIIDTATHMVTGSAITMPGMVHDAAPVPGSNRIAVATSAGISIVDLDSMQIGSGSGASVDRVTVGPTLDGHLVAYGLVNRIAPPAGPVDPCTGTSSIVTVDVDTPGPATPMALSQAVSDLAAAPDTPMLYAALPCANKISRLDGMMFTDFSSLERAAVVAVAGQRVWAVGTHAAVPACSNSAGTPVTPCPTNSTAECPGTAGNTIDYVTTGDHLVVQSVPLMGGMPVELAVPEPRETMISTDDPARQHAQVLRSLAISPLDLVVLPGGQYVALVTTNTYYITSLTDQIGDIVLPCLKTQTSDWLLMDMASSSVAQRVRTECKLTTGPHDNQTIFRNWECEDPPEGEKPMMGEFTPMSVGALFGAR
jgi:hypothetical protein